MSPSTPRPSTCGRRHPFAADAWTQRLEAAPGGPAHNPMGVDWYAMLFGLGFVLSFGYWCTNFLVMQRAMAAKNMTAARRTPLIAAVPKMLFPVLVILPGMIAVALMAVTAKGYRLPPKIARSASNAKAIPGVKDAAAQTSERPPTRPSGTSARPSA